MTAATPVRSGQGNASVVMMAAVEVRDPSVPTTTLKPARLAIAADYIWVMTPLVRRYIKTSFADDRHGRRQRSSSTFWTFHGTVPEVGAERSPRARKEGEDGPRPLIRLRP